MIYDFDALFELSDGEAINGGKRRFYDNRVSSISRIDENGTFKISGEVRGNVQHFPKIEFDENGELKNYLCDCELHLKNSVPCKHIIALALAFEEKFPHSQGALRNAVVRDRTDAIALTLSAEYAKKRRSKHFFDGVQRCKLVPILCLNDDRLSLKFMIGSSKLYVLKDVGDFVSAFLNCAYRRYGVELELEHSLESFDEESAELIEFVIASHLEKTDISKQLALRDMPSALKPVFKDELMLFLSDVDSFFEMKEGRLLEFANRNVRDGMRLVERGENNFCPSVEVERVKGGFLLTCPFEKFSVIYGRKNVYFITDSKIYKLTHSFATAVIPFLKTFDTFKKMYIADVDMPFFYNNVLFSVAEYLNINCKDFDLSIYEAVPLVSKLYIHATSSGALSARLECSYDGEIIDIYDENLVTGFVRDYEAENALKTALSQYFPPYPAFEISGEDDIYNFLSEGVAKLLPHSDLFLEENVKRLRSKRSYRIRTGVKVSGSLLKLDFDSDELKKEDLVRVLKGYAEKKRYVRLTDGSFAELDDEGAKQLMEFFDIRDDFDGALFLEKYYAPHLNSVLSESAFSFERDAGFKELIKELRSVSDLDIAVPNELRDVLRAYQKTGYRWLKTLSKYDFGGILADDMGLGKSLQVISLILSYATGNEKKQPSIIVCPTTLTLNWVNEFNKFAPSLRTMAVSGNYEERRLKAEKIDNEDVIIISYELLRRDYEFYKDKHFRFAIIDEAQYIKNPETKNAQAVKELKAQHRFALTGTPIENSLSELWSIFDFVMPKYLGNYLQFRDRFEAIIASGDERSKAVAENLRKLVSPFILRRLKSEVLSELPAKMEINVEAQLEDEQRLLYFAVLNQIRESINAEDKNVNKITVLSMLTKLRQICCEPRLAYQDYNGNSAKFETCMELLNEAIGSGHKVLLFSQFTSMLECFRNRLSLDGISHYVLKGDTQKTERIRLVNRFNSDDTKVFLISLKAGGTGLNLTGADVVIHYDPWWNESVMNQATDRAYRIGQSKPVQVYKLIMRETIEQAIVKLQEKKSKLLNMVVGKESGGTEVSFEDIMSILKNA